MEVWYHVQWKLEEIIKGWLGRKACTRKLKSFASTVVQPGKTFPGRTYQLMKGAQQDYYKLCAPK